MNLIKSSSELRKLIISKMEENNVNLYKLCRALDLSYNYMRIYIRNLSSPNVIGEKSIITLCGALGITVRLTVINGDVDKEFIKPLQNARSTSHSKGKYGKRPVNSRINRILDGTYTGRRNKEY